MPVPVLRPEFRPFEPRGGARQLIYCRDPAICYHGPAGTGKTRTVLEKGFLCANLWPNARILLLRKLRADLTESVLATFENEVLPDGHPLKDGANRKTRASYDLTNGSTLVCGGMKNADGSDSRRVMSTEWDLILCFESTEFTYDDFQKLTTRLHRYKRMPFSQIILDCNPAGPKHWLKIEMDAGRITSIPSRHEDNPKWHNGKGWTPDGEVYIGQLDKLTGYNHDRLRKGLWTAAEGVVYDAFDERIHVIDAMPQGWRRWRRIRSIDFGFTNPFVCQWWALDPDGRMYLYREIYRAERLVADHAEIILEQSEGEPIDLTVADHDAEDRATLWAAGIPTAAARKDVIPGIEAVKRRLRRAQDGKPRIFFLRNALLERDGSLTNRGKPASTLEEFGGYVWAPPKEGRPADEEPLKIGDHGMDAMRYAAMAAEAVDPTEPVTEPPPPPNSLGWILRHEGQFGDEYEENGRDTFV